MRSHRLLPFDVLQHPPWLAATACRTERGRDCASPLRSPAIRCWRHPYLVIARRLPASLLGYDFSPSRGIHSYHGRPTFSPEAHGP